MPLLPANMDDRDMLNKVLCALEPIANEPVVTAVVRDIRAHLALSTTNKCRIRLVVDVACATRDGTRVDAALNSAFDQAVSGGIIPPGASSNVLRWQKKVFQLQGV